MAWKHLLVHVDAGPRAAERVALASSLARRSGARLTGLFSESGAMGPGIGERRDPDRIAADEAEARATFEAAAAGLATDWWSVGGGDYAHVVGWTVVCCRYADVAIFAQQPAEGARLPADALEQVLDDSGRPILVVPHAGHFPEVGRRVLVAWTGSRESARALNDALPILERAREVSVLSIQRAGPGQHADAPPLDVVAHLAAHGVKASYERFVLDEVRAVDHVLNTAADSGADLTVMGAHAHRHFPYLPRTGTTHDILRMMTTPVLLSR